jgi:hypothetical protein
MCDEEISISDAKWRKQIPRSVMYLMIDSFLYSVRVCAELKIHSGPEKIIPSTKLKKKLTNNTILPGK